MELEDLCKKAQQRHENIKGGYKVENVSDIDKEKLLAHILNHHAEISRDPDFLKRVIKSMTTPAQDQKYKLYEGITEWLEEITALLPAEIQEQADIRNVTEQDCAEWLTYIIGKYDLSQDDDFMDGLALLMRTDPDGWTTEDYRL